MKTKYYLFLTILLITIIFAVSCAPQQQTKAPETSTTPSAEKTNPDQNTNAKDDFGCWPPSCSSIPDPQGKQACTDWKAGKTIQWPSDCTSLQSTCAKLCEVEKASQPPSQQPQQQQSYTNNQGNSPQTTNAPAQKQVFNTLPSLVKAEFASDVSEEDKNFNIQGISTMDFYLQEWFGKSTDKPSGLQVSSGGKDASGGATVKTESGTAIILIDTGNFGWQRQIQSNKDIGGEWRPRLVAHEYVHVFQFQNGCSFDYVEHPIAPIAPKWFIEGEAEWLSYKATIDAGQLPPISIPQLVTPPAKQVVGSLESFEKPQSVQLTESSPTYFLFNMAIDYLMKDRQIKTLDDFCANIGNGMSMPKAFETAFGIPLNKFYEDFESYRKTW